jgi:hypothetical protein
MSVIDIDGDAAREAARHELAKPIYPRASPLQRLLDWAETMLRSLIAHGSTVPGGWFTISVLLIMAVAAAVVAARFGRRMLASGRGADHRLFGRAELSAAEHRGAAERCAAAGDWAPSIRHRLRAVARQLEESETLEPAPGRTANELARDAGAALPPLASALSCAAATFNDVSYGGLPGTETGYRALTELDDQLRSRSPAGPSEAPPPAAAGQWTQVS